MKTELTIDRIIEIEGMVIALRKELESFRSELPPDGTRYGELYNYLGTLKVNLNNLYRQCHSVSLGINVNC